MGFINQLMTGGHHPVVFHKSPSDGLYEVLVRRDEGNPSSPNVSISTTTTTRWNCGL
jgi:hypothetical protein